MRTKLIKQLRQDGYELNSYDCKLRASTMNIFYSHKITMGNDEGTITFKFTSEDRNTNEYTEAVKNY